MSQRNGNNETCEPWCVFCEDHDGACLNSQGVMDMQAERDEAVALLRRFVALDGGQKLKPTRLDARAFLARIDGGTVHYIRAEFPVCGAKFPTNYSRKSAEVTCAECRAEFDVFDRDQTRGGAR